jgi:hypothetical protein
MKLSEAYNKVFIGEFWKKLEEDLLIDEGTSGLENLIGKANEIIFKKFRINPSERKYCIVGSARLYLYPELREAFGLSGTIGDLDIVIPNKQDWINAGLEEEWNKDGIYRPTDDGSIEAFNVWAPQRAGGQYADVNVRSTEEIIKAATSINGYYFMAFEDIVDYKTAMSRDKEQDIVNLIKKYQQSGSSDRKGFLRTMAKMIGIDKTKEFLGKIAR